MDSFVMKLFWHVKEQLEECRNVLEHNPKILAQSKLISSHLRYALRAMKY